MGGGNYSYRKAEVQAGIFLEVVVCVCVCVQEAILQGEFSPQSWPGDDPVGRALPLSSAGGSVCMWVQFDAMSGCSF